MDAPRGSAAVRPKAPRVGRGLLMISTWGVFKSAQTLRARGPRPIGAWGVRLVVITFSPIQPPGLRGCTHTVGIKRFSGNPNPMSFQFAD
jgi:hypothetical protein